jgi:hypothetical protein
MMTDIKQAARAEAERITMYTEDRGRSEWLFIAGVKWLSEYLLSDETVEKAARAFHAEQTDGSPWDREVDSVQAAYLSDARAALSAGLGKETS